MIVVKRTSLVGCVFGVGGCVKIILLSTDYGSIVLLTDSIMYHYS